MEKENTTLKRKSSFLYGMLALNIVLMVVLIGSLVAYVSYNHKKMYQVSIQRVADSATFMAGQVENYVSNQNTIVKNCADYIQKQNLSENDAINYLAHWSGLYKEISLVNIKDYEGNVLEGNANYKKSFANSDWAKKFCDIYSSGKKEETNVHISEVFYLEDIEENAVVFYQPVKIENVDKMLFFTVPMSKFKENSKNWEDLEESFGIAIDEEGKILFGDISGKTEADSNNYFLYIENTVGRDARNTVWDSIHNTKEGDYVIRESDGSDWICIFTKIDGTNDWTYVYRVNKNELIKGNFDIKMVVAAFVLMVMWLLMDVVAYHGYSKKIGSVLGVVEQKNQELQVANQAKNIFISNISHEIRTPINAVLGMDEMIIRETDDDTIRRYAYDIKNAGKVLLGIINDILDYSKIDSGKMEIVNEEYAVASVVNDVYNMIEVKAKEKNLKLDMVINPQIPRILYGDELRLKQIIINLLSNAVKYTDKGTVTFSLDYENLENDEINLLVSVKDTGIGMKEEEVQRMFVAFERLDEKRNGNIEGTGLGITIVTRLLNQMGSKLSVESVYGDGSTFSFKLRQKVLDRASVGGIRTIRQQREEVKGNPEQDTILKASKAKILAVDDNQVNLTVVKGLLKRTGAQLDCATSGQECLDLCSKVKYDLILLDHRMPQMDGIETLKRLKEMPEFDKATPIIALTANVVSGAREMYISEGFTDFLAKPISGNKMERMIQHYLPKSCLDSEEDVASAISMESGIAACGSEKVYNQVARQFVELAADNIKEIQTLYEEQDVKNYTIKVHALKSSARFVGANQLSKEAASLEGSGNAGLWHEIEVGTDKLLQHYELTVANLRKMLNLDEVKQSKQNIDPEVLKSALTAIREFNGAFDFDSVDGVMKSLEQYDLPDDLKGDFEELKAAVYKVDQQAIEDIVKKHI